jgi:hypothetical protein
MTKDEGDVVSVLLLPSFSNRRKGGCGIRYNDVVYRIKIKTSTQYNNNNNNNNKI